MTGLFFMTSIRLMQTYLLFFQELSGIGKLIINLRRKMAHDCTAVYKLSLPKFI